LDVGGRGRGKTPRPPGRTRPGTLLQRSLSA
jgi:hypothetical protein